MVMNISFYKSPRGLTSLKLAEMRAFLLAKGEGLRGLRGVAKLNNHGKINNII